MGKVDDVDTPDTPSSNTTPVDRPVDRRDDLRRGGRYSSLRDDDDGDRYSRSDRYGDDRYSGRYGNRGGDRYSSRYGSVLSEVETQSGPETKPVQLEHWFHTFWRPAMAWLYFAICAFDFILAPMFTWWFAYLTTTKYVPWEPLTLRGGGLIHVSLGAIIGIYTWSRTREKLADVSADSEYYRR